MSSSSELLREFARTSKSAGDPGFAVIVAFDYYDGPEHGLALYPSGDAVRFSSLGDSRSRLFRAFELVAIEGTWWPQVRALQQAAGVDPPRRMLVPSDPSDTLAQLERDTLQAPSIEQFVGVGSADLERISISPITRKQLEDLQRIGCSPAGFELAHRMVKRPDVAD